jgi:hypothetical protein
MRSGENVQSISALGGYINGIIFDNSVSFVCHLIYEKEQEEHNDKEYNFHNIWTYFKTIFIHYII